VSGLDVDLPRVELPRSTGAMARQLAFLLAASDRPRVLTASPVGSRWGTAAAIAARSLGREPIVALSGGRGFARIDDLRATGARVVLTRAPRLRLPLLWLRYGRPAWLPADGASALGVVGAVEAGLDVTPAAEHVVAPTPAILAGVVIGLQLAGVRAGASGPGDPERVAGLAQACARLLRRHGADLGVLDLGPDAFAAVAPEGGRVVTIEP
jgi:hypothetical protein